MNGFFSNFDMVIIIQIIIVVLLITYGALRGATNMILPVVTLVASVIIAGLLNASVTNFVKNNTNLYANLEEKYNVSQMIGIDIYNYDYTLNAENANAVIDNLPNVPAELKQLLKENNTSEKYQELGVSKFNDYISSFIANTIVRTICFAIASIILFIIFKILSVLFIERLINVPIIRGANRIIGGIMGGAIGLGIAYLIKNCVNILL